jgi:transketolase
LLSTGAALGLALDWQAQPDFADHAVYSMPLWSMAAKRGQMAQLWDFDEVRTLEDHLHDGGFGSWLLEAQAQAGQARGPLVTPLALDPVVCGTVGSQAMLNRLGGLVPA